jgi:UPF0148 protein
MRVRINNHIGRCATEIGELSQSDMREMAEMLRKGAKMLSLTCPECASPLFQLKTGEVYCLSCKREVRIVKDGEDAGKAALDASLEKTLQAKLQLIHQRLYAETDPIKIKELADTIAILLNVLKQLKVEEKPRTK